MRENRYMKRGAIWCFQINRRWVRDAAVGGNIARFINHSCRGNCYVHIVGDIIWIRASRTIRKGEELTYDYMTDGEGQDRVPLPAGLSAAACRAAGAQQLESLVQQESHVFSCQMKSRLFFS